MRKEKAECQRCGHWMVPRVIFEKAIYLDGVPIGGDRAIASVCPFCLSEEWNGPGFKSRRFKRAILQALEAIAPILILLGAMVLLVGVKLIQRYLAGE